MSIPRRWAHYRVLETDFYVFSVVSFARSSRAATSDFLICFFDRSFVLSMFECHVRFERIFASKILTWAVAVTVFHEFILKSNDSCNCDDTSHDLAMPGIGRDPSPFAYQELKENVTIQVHPLAIDPSHMILGLLLCCFQNWFKKFYSRDNTEVVSFLVNMTQHPAFDILLNYPGTADSSLTPMNEYLP